MKQYKYHCIYCNHDWHEEREEEYKNAPCVMPCPKCGEYFVNRVRVSPPIGDFWNSKGLENK